MIDFSLSESDEKILAAVREQALVCRTHARYYDDHEDEEYEDDDREYDDHEEEEYGEDEEYEDDDGYEHGEEDDDDD